MEQNTKIALVPAETEFLCEESKSITLDIIWQSFEVHYKKHVAELQKKPRERFAEEIAKTLGPATSDKTGEKDYAHLLMMKEKK